MCVCQSMVARRFRGGRGYKSPSEGSAGRPQYHSQSSGGSREAVPAGRPGAAEFLRMALDVLGPSI